MYSSCINSESKFGNISITNCKLNDQMLEWFSLNHLLLSLTFCESLILVVIYDFNGSFITLIYILILNYLSNITILYIQTVFGWIYIIGFMMYILDLIMILSFVLNVINWKSPFFISRLVCTFWLKLIIHFNKL